MGVERGAVGSGQPAPRLTIDVLLKALEAPVQRAYAHRSFLDFITASPSRLLLRASWYRNHIVRCVSSASSILRQARSSYPETSHIRTTSTQRNTLHANPPCSSQD